MAFDVTSIPPAAEVSATADSEMLSGRGEGQCDVSRSVRRGATSVMDLSLTRVRNINCFNRLARAPAGLRHAELPRGSTRLTLDTIDRAPQLI
jgi:hypothetical protein